MVLTKGMTWEKRPPQGSLLKTGRQLAFALTSQLLAAMTGLRALSLTLPRELGRARLMLALEGCTAPFALDCHCYKE